MQANRLSEDQGEGVLTLSQKVVRARDRKFHKRFKNLPESEKVIKVYHCAFVGDILLQGYLYVTTDTLCFYSKILGRERQIEIPISEVVDITREKTAFIIPNAIGIHTADNCKYVFGSLVSRNRTYRLIFSVWKRVVGRERLLASPLTCDEIDDVGNGSYKRDASPSSADKTSSDESYFTDTDHLSKSVLPPPALHPPHPPSTPSSPSPSTSFVSNSNQHRRSSTATLTAARTSITGCQEPLLQQHLELADPLILPRRKAALASSSRSPGHEHRHRNFEKTAAAISDAGNRDSNWRNRLLTSVNGITPIGWWAIACTVLTFILTVFGIVILWKVVQLQTEVVQRLYQLSLIENRRLRAVRRSPLTEGRVQQLTDVVGDYTMATDRLLVAVRGLQSVLRSNMEIVVQMCKLMTSLHYENRTNGIDVDKAECL